MRKVARVSKSGTGYEKIMIYDAPQGAYLFYYEEMSDVGASADDLYETLEIADEVACEEFGIKEEDWIYVLDPLEDCQDDIIRPVRVLGRDTGTPEWSKYEIFDGYNWHPFFMDE